MSNTLIVEIAPQLPDPALPNADWADTFEIKSGKTFDTMRSLAKQTVGTIPRWARVLMGLRNLIVRPFGLKTELADADRQAGDTIGLFPILEETADRIVLGVDDRHLDFRIVIEREACVKSVRIRATTLVQRHNVFGKIYIAVVTPFHKLIVSSALKQAI